ncbi:MAG: SAM-dependent methyltransferase [Acidobacteriota bacterium]
MRKFVSRGGLKLDHALDHFELSVAGLLCADFGCSTGGFTDCLLQRGARRVIALDTGYGVLDYSLRIDGRVEVRERSNVLHAPPPDENVDLVVSDLSWTRQSVAVEVARRWLGQGGRHISLIKPHYEIEPDEKKLLRKGVLPPEESERIFRRVVGQLGDSGVEVLSTVRSPIAGGGSRSGKGNVEYLALLAFPAAE